MLVGPVSLVMRLCDKQTIDCHKNKCYNADNFISIVTSG